MSMFFETCAVCEVEEGMKDMVLVDTVRAELNASGIKKLYEAMIAPLDDAIANKHDKIFASVVQRELPYGLLKGREYVCKQCLRELPKKQKMVSKVWSPGTQDISYLYWLPTPVQVTVF